MRLQGLCYSERTSLRSVGGPQVEEIYTQLGRLGDTALRAPPFQPTGAQMLSIGCR